MNFPVVCAIFFFAHCFYIINGGPAYFNLETLEVSHRSDLFVPGEDYTGKHEFFLSPFDNALGALSKRDCISKFTGLLFLDPGTLVSHHSGSDPFVPDEEYTGKHKFFFFLEKNLNSLRVNLMTLMIYRFAV